MAYNIDINDLTSNVTITSTNEVTGSGIFDTLMETVTKHIKAQYQEDRIVGGEYATVYLGALQSVLQLSVKILLDKDLVAKQLEEIDSRIALNNSNISLANKQMLAIDADIGLKTSQKALIDQQKLTEVQQTSLVEAQKDKVDYETNSLLPKQLEKLTYEVGTLLPSQNSLITAQTTSEEAKEALIKYQRHGFKVDATYKYIKVLLDTWSIYYSITPGSENLLEAIKKPGLDNTVGQLNSAIAGFDALLS